MMTIRAFFFSVMVQVVAGELPYANRIFSELVNKRVESCPGSPDIVGYTSIAAINLDQRDMLNEIEKQTFTDALTGGAAVQTRLGTLGSAYFFTLCPRAYYDTSAEPLEVLLNDAVFACGENGVQQEDCFLGSGPHQVIFPNSTAEGYKVTTASFYGLSFENFEEKSIYVHIDYPIVANFFDVLWRGFESEHIIEHRAYDVSSTINIKGGQIINAVGGDLFLNIAGSMHIDGVTMWNVTANSFLVSQNSAMSSLNNSYFTQGSFNSITSTTGGSRQSASTITIMQMDSVHEVFQVTGRDSVLNVDSVGMELNGFESNHDKISGVVARNFSLAYVTNTNFFQNSGVKYGYSAVGGSTLILSSSSINGNTGATGDATNLVNAGDSSVVFVETVFMENNTGFTAQVGARSGGIINFDALCILSGQSVATIAIDKDSSYRMHKVYIHPTVESSLCGGGENGRIALERDVQKSECLGYSGSCSHQCIPGDVYECGGIPLFPRTVTCSEDSDLVGYASIDALNLDQRDIVLAGGYSAPLTSNSETYTTTKSSQVNATHRFILCPNNFFDASVEPLEILLDNSLFTCGENGTLDGNCVISGSSAQVLIGRSTVVDRHNVETTTLSGMTFHNFLNTSLVVNLDYPAVVNLIHVRWTEFDSLHIVDTTGSKSSISINVENSEISNGVGEELFVSVGGNINIAEAAVTNVTANAFLVSRENATASLQNSFFTRSSLQSVTRTTTGSSQFVMGATVMEMISLEDVFLVTDPGSLLAIEASHIIQNTEGIKNGFVARGSSSAYISGCSFVQNKDVTHGISSETDSTIIISDSSIVGNEGTSRGDKFLFYASSSGEISTQSLYLEANTEFTAQFKAEGGSLNINAVCIMSGASEAVIFIDKNSRYSSYRLFVDPSIESSICGEAGGRLTVEQDVAESECFSSSGSCVSDCLPGDIVQCGDFPDDSDMGAEQINEVSGEELITGAPEAEP